MNDTQASEFLRNIDPGVEYKIAVKQAEFRIQFYRNDSECNLWGYTAEDVVMDVFLKILENPDLLNKDELSVEKFRKRVRGMINNVIFTLTQKKEVQTTLSYDPTEVMIDEVFFEQVTAHAIWSEQSAQLREEQTALLDEVAEELLLKDSDAWLVLDELRNGKKPKDIAEENNKPIEYIRNLVKNVKRAIANKAKVQVRS